MVDVIVGDAGLGEGRGAGDAERVRGGEILHLADYEDEIDLIGARTLMGALKLFAESFARLRRDDRIRPYVDAPESDAPTRTRVRAYPD